MFLVSHLAPPELNTFFLLHTHAHTDRHTYVQTRTHIHTHIYTQPHTCVLCAYTHTYFIQCFILPITSNQQFTMLSILCLLPGVLQLLML